MVWVNFPFLSSSSCYLCDIIKTYLKGFSQHNKAPVAFCSSRIKHYKASEQGQTEKAASMACPASGDLLLGYSKRPVEIQFEENEILT